MIADNYSQQNVVTRMTPFDWEVRFEQLFDLYLIDIGDNYYNEKVPFSDPKELEDKFVALETQNLFYMNRLQDNEE